MGSSYSAEAYCLLDNVQITEEVQLRQFLIRRFTPGELAQLAAPHDDTSADKDEDLTEESNYAWARTEVNVSDPPPDAGASPLRRHFHAVFARMRPSDRAMLDFAYKNTIDAKGSWPFGELIRVLNLLKPAGAPVQAGKVIFRAHPYVQTKRQVAWVGRGPRSDEQAGAAAEYGLTAADASAYTEVSKQLADIRAGKRDGAAHLQVSLEWFEHADREVALSPEDFDAIRLLLAYDAAIEALVIAKKGEGENHFVKRVSAIAKPAKTYAAWVRSGGRYRREHRAPTPDQLRDFARRIWRIRSKAAHGVWPVKKLATFIGPWATREIPKDENDKDSIPKGPWDRLFLAAKQIPGFLMQVREVARQSIRYFIDEWANGRSRGKTLESLR